MASSPQLLQAVAHMSAGRLPDARAALAAIHDGGGAEALTAARFLAHLDAKAGRVAEAIAALERALRDSADPRLLAQLAELTMQTGDYARAQAYAEQALARAPQSAVLRLNAAIWRAGHTDDPGQARRELEAWCDAHLPAATVSAAALARRDPRRDRALRIGYVSGDLGNHAVRYFIEPYLRHHDRERFPVHVFMTQPHDAISPLLREHVAHWHDVPRDTPEQLAARIRQLGIDVLVDLSGHTEGERLATFALRAAPVQVTWWGFVTTLGMRQMDWRLTDARHCPVGSDAHYTEGLWRLSCLTAYQPPLHCDELMPSPWRSPGALRSSGQVTMVSLNHCRKLSDAALQLWGEVLARNPRARLLLLTTASNHADAEAMLLPRCARLGLPRERVVALPRLSMLDFLGLRAVADFALDSLPVSGGVTTLHALWMGLPVLALRSPQPIALQNYTANTLATLGLEDCVANDRAEYLARADQWLRHPEQLDTLRPLCRARLQASPFLAHEARARELESAFAQMWAARVEGLAERHDPAAAPLT